MVTVLPEIFETTLPTEADQSLAEKSSEKLSVLAEKYKNLRVQFMADENYQSEVFLVPSSVLGLLMTILKETAKGNAITLIPIHAELTTQEAADILNVSRPFLINLLNEGKIPYRKVGTHRRILFKDLKEYKEKSRLESFQTLSDLVAQAQELDMGY